MMRITRGRGCNVWMRVKDEPEHDLHLFYHECYNSGNNSDSYDPTRYLELRGPLGKWEYISKRVMELEQDATQESSQGS